MCNSSQIKIEDGILMITYYYKSEGDSEDWEGLKQRRNNEVWQYLNPQSGYLDLSSWGIIDVKCETEVST